MEFDFSKLKGRIVEKYNSQAKFAEALGVVPLTVSRKMTNENPFTSKEIVKWCELLEIAISEIPLYFFSFKSSQVGTSND